MALTIDGSLADWSSNDRINDNSNPGYDIYGAIENGTLYFGLKAPTVIGTNTTVWLNTDGLAATGFQIFGYAGGAEYQVNFDSDTTANLYSYSLVNGAPTWTLLGPLTAAWSADRMTVELGISMSSIGNPGAVYTLYDINNLQFLPSDYTFAPYAVFADTNITPAADTRIGIVYSETTANSFFSKTAYSQLFMSVQEQAMQAGVTFDILTESDLTDLAKLAQYDTLVFPSFRNVQPDQVEAITHTLEQATTQFGIGLIAAGEFMTNGPGAPGQEAPVLAGDPYARMKLLFDVQRVTGGTGDVTINATDLNGLVLDGYANGQLIRDYDGIGWNAFSSYSGSGTTIASQTINGASTYAAVLATQTGGRNVLFSTEGVMADANMLQQAIDYAVNGTGVSVGLQLTRQSGIVAARVDMDQSQEYFDVRPENGGPGIYDKLLPILTEWKQLYNFVGSYYLNVGNNTQNGQYTDWSVSGPYYKALYDLGSELGTHSYTHPDDTNTLTNAQIQFEFGNSIAVLEANLRTALNNPNFQITGAALPGAPELLDTTLKILPYVDKYLTGGYAAQGAGYPNAFGYLLPDQQDKIYFAPNMSFDFTLIEFQHKTLAEAEAAWKAEYDALRGNAETPVIVWPWHDYGAADWNTNGAGDSPYDTSMFANWIARAFADDMEFVTLDDLASRMNALAGATITSSISGNTITATVNAGASNVGQMALDVDGQGGLVIQNVNGWYAYDSDSVYLPQSGGSFTINLGPAQDDVTHITDLPMRATLLTLSGDGHDLSFSLLGEGKVIIDLAARGTNGIVVNGAAVSSLNGDILTLDVGTYGTHNVTVTFLNRPIITSNVAVSTPENSTAVMTVTANDPDLGTVLTYSLTGGADQTKFAINAATGALSFLAAPNFEAPGDAGTNNVYDVVVRVSDGTLYAEQAIAVTVTNVNEAPVITSSGGGTSGTAGMSENSTLAVTIAASDPDAGDTLRYTIIGGADSALFTLNETSGALTFLTAPDYENPADTDRNNVYQVTVAVTDALGLQDTQQLSVSVTNLRGVTLNAGRSGSTLNGTIEEDVLKGRVGNDILNGLGGNDTLTGDDGADILNGGDGNDSLNGGWGADILDGDAGNDILSGEGSADTLNGGDGNDNLNGGAANDILDGGNGIDILFGGAGADQLTGGADDDIFRFNATGNSGTASTTWDIITDFGNGLDIIDLAGIDANTSITGNQAFLFMGQGTSFSAARQLNYNFEFIGGVEYTIVRGNVNGNLAPDFAIALLGHHDLSASDFIL